MLVDLEFTPEYLKKEIVLDRFEVTPEGHLIVEGNYHSINKSGQPQSVPYGTTIFRCQQGVYGGGLNFDHTINLLTTSKTVDSFDWSGQWSYGVADSVEQILEYHSSYSDYSEAPLDKFVLSVTMIQKRYETPNAGWRWEKWGSYIGTKKRQADYIYDEPEIDEVLVYQFYQVEPKGVPQS